MKKLAFVALMIGGLALGQSKKVIASDVHWWGYKIAKSEASSHDGIVAVKSGTIEVKDNKIIGGRFLLDMTTISATDVKDAVTKAKLDGHLKNGDFFEVDKYPNAEFVITSIKPNSDKIYSNTIMGNLTIKGQTNAISFPAKLHYSKGIANIVTDKFSFDRQKFNISYKSSMQDVLIKDEIDMKIKVTAK